MAQQTPKEKAQELKINFYNIIKHPESDYWEDARECALLAVAFAKENPLNSVGYNVYLDEVKEELTKH